MPARHTDTTLVQGTQETRGRFASSAVQAQTNQTAPAAAAIPDPNANKPFDPYVPAAQQVTDPNFQYVVTQYPNDLGSSRYPHQVFFYINANTASKITFANGGTGAAGTVDLVNGGQSNAQKVGSQTAKGVNSVINSTNAAGTAASSAVNSAVGKPLLGDLKIPTIDANRWTTQKKRLKKALALPMPHSFTASYSASYGQLSTGGILGTLFNNLANGSKLEDAAKQALSDLIQTAPGTIVKTAAVGAASLGGSLLGGAAGAGIAAGAVYSTVDAATINGIASKASGRALNERLEQIFRSINFRSFQLDWVIAPRSETEALEIQDIIQTFKLHMHPETIDNSSFLLMPDEIDIEFVFGGSENTFVNKVTTCVLDAVNVNYAPTGQWITFDGGVPAMIGLSLHFTELQPLTRNSIAQGY